MAEMTNVQIENGVAEPLLDQVLERLVQTMQDDERFSAGVVGGFLEADARETFADKRRIVEILRVDLG